MKASPGNPDTQPPWLQESKDGLVLLTHCQPGAKRTECAGQHGERLKIRLKAPPRDGKANRELRRFLGDILDLPKSQVTLLRGARQRRKDIQLDGITYSKAVSLLTTRP